MDIKVCDICGKKINAFQSYFYTVTVVSYLISRNKDICKECFERIDDEIRNGSDKR